MKVPSAVSRHWDKRNDYIGRGKDFVQETWDYAKSNPDDVLLALITVAVLDIEDDVDDIESAYSIHEFRG